MGREIYKKVITITQPDRCFSGFRKGQGHPASATKRRKQSKDCFCCIQKFLLHMYARAKNNIEYENKRYFPNTHSPIAAYTN